MITVRVDEIFATPLTEEEIAKQELEIKLQEAQTFLDKTDKKVLPYYDFEEDDNDLQWYVVERAKARAFIRTVGVVPATLLPVTSCQVCPTPITISSPAIVHVLAGVVTT